MIVQLYVRKGCCGHNQHASDTNQESSKDFHFSIKNEDKNIKWQETESRHHLHHYAGN